MLFYQLSAQAAKQDSNPAKTANSPVSVDQHELKQSDKTTQDGDRAIKMFTEKYPSDEKVKDFYEGLTPQGYDEWARRVNFNEPYYIVDEVARLITTNSFGAGTARKVKMLDMGAGTGLIGMKLC